MLYYQQYFYFRVLGTCIVLARMQGLLDTLVKVFLNRFKYYSKHLILSRLVACLDIPHLFSPLKREV
jgi:hypothetical protein